MKSIDSFWNVTFFEEVDSTNTRIKEVIRSGGCEGTCFVARRQTAAYGRQGRSWSSPEGGLYFSFILDPLDAHADAGKALSDLPALSLLLSLGVQSALSAFIRSDKIKIKWPNDILVVRDKIPAKLCGISLEVVNGKLCCGIGINIIRPTIVLTDALLTGYAPAYLSDLASGDLELQDRATVHERLLPQVLNEVSALYQEWIEAGIAPFIPRYDALLYNRGHHVTLEAIDGTSLYSGKVIGVSPSGQLIIEEEDGTQIAANSGEVHTRHL